MDDSSSQDRDGCRADIVAASLDAPRRIRVHTPRRFPRTDAALSHAVAKESDGANMPTPAMSRDDQPTASETPKPSWKIRLYGILRHLAAHNAVRILALVLVFVGVTSLAVWTATQVWKRGPLLEEVSLEDALRQLDEGEFERARVLASKLFAHGSNPEHDVPGALFIYGASLELETQQTDDQDKKHRLHLMASRYLEEVHLRGYPEGRDAAGLDLYARSLYHSGHYARSLPILRAAIERSGTQQPEQLQLLAEAYCRDSNPQWLKAFEVNEQYLKGSDLEPAARVEAMLRKGKIEFALGRIAESRATLESIPEATNQRAEMLLMAARLEMQDAESLTTEGDREDRARERLAQAIELLKRAQKVDGNRDIASRKADYLLGLCFQRQGDAPKALNQFSRAASAHYGTPEGIAAGAREAQALLAEGNDKAAVEAFARVLVDAGEKQPYSNEWISLDELQESVEGAFRQLAERQEFDLAVQLTRSMPPLLPEVMSVRLRATGQRMWAEQLMESARQQSYSQAQATQAEARSHYRRAGQAYSRLARLRKASREFTDDLWNSGDNFARGQDYDRSDEKFRQFLFEEPKKRRAETLVRVAEVRLAAGRTGEALDALSECILYHDQEPSIYRARLLASQTHFERNEPQRAIELLRSNLDNESLTPQSIEWRESLFELGKIQFREAESRMYSVINAPAGQGSGTSATNEESVITSDEVYDGFEQVLDTLGEAVARFTDAEHAVESRYLLAKCQMALTRLDQNQLSSQVLDSSRGLIERQIKRRLVDVAADMEKLRNTLMTQRELPPLESLLLRNTIFIRADAMYELGDYKTAIDEYKLAIKQLPQESLTLEALVQISNCHRRARRPEEARATIVEAQNVLNKLPADTDFVKTSRNSREEWQQLLNWMLTL